MSSRQSIRRGTGFRACALFGIILLLSLTRAASQWPFIVPPDSGMLASLDSGRNTVAEGTSTGSLAQVYSNYPEQHLWQRTITQIASNGLFRVDYWLYFVYGSSPAMKPKPNLSILLFRSPEVPGNEIPFNETNWENALRFQLGSFRRPVPQSRPAQKALRAIEEALSAAQFFSANATYYQFRGSSNSMEFSAQLHELFPGVPQSGGSVLRRVRLFVEVGQDYNPRCKCHPVSLVLEHNPLILDGYVQPFRIILAKQPFGFFLSYLDGASMQWADSWTSSDSMPRQVHVSLLPPTLELASRTITLPVTPVPAALQIRDTNGPARPTNGNPQQLLEPEKASNSRANPPLTLTRPPRVERFDVELEWLGRSGVELARYILARSESPQFDSLNQKWAGGVGDTNSFIARIPMQDFPLGGGTISLRITDLDRRFNINLVPSFPELVQQGLIQTGVDPQDAISITDALLDWQDADDSPRAAGVESDYYLTLDPPHPVKNGPLDDLAELLMVKGVTPRMFFGTTNAGESAVGLKDLFTTVSGRLININTASAHVLQLIPDVDGNMAQAIITTRAGPDGVEGNEDDMPFRSAGEIRNVPGMTPEIVNTFSRYLGTRSSTFEVTVDVTLGRQTRQYSAWLQRIDANTIDTLKLYRSR